MITVNFKDGDTFAKVYGLKQWDFGQKVYITGLNVQGETIEVHVANVGSDVALRVLGAVHDGNITADIPDVLLQVGSDLKIYIYESTEVEGKTIATAYVQVGKREKPEDYDPPEAQNILQEILAIAKTTKEIAQSVRDDADNGAFDGAPGEDGYSPSVLLAEVEDGVQITVRNKEGDTTALVKNGKDGLPGESAYQIAVRLGFKGTEQEWIESLKYDHSEEFANLAEEVRNTANGIVADRQQIQKNAVDIESLGNNKADAIVSTASGDQITLMDSDNELFKGLHVYGKSTQQTTKGVNLLNLGDIGRVITSEDKIGTAVVKENGVQVTYTGQTTPINSDIYFYGNKASSVESGYEEVPELTPGNYYAYSNDENVIFYIVIYHDGNTSAITSSSGNYSRFSVQEGYKYRIFFRLKDSSGVTNRLVQPMIGRDEGLNGPYEPYTGGKPSPSIEYPQEIMSAGDKGNVNIQVEVNVESVQNLLLHTPNGLPGIPVSTGGNYTDANGQQWICDEIDLARGKYVQRIAENVWDTVSFINMGSEKFQNNTPGAYKLKGATFVSMANFARYSALANKSGGFAAFDKYFYYRHGSEIKVEELNELFNSKAPIKIIGQLDTPIERDLTQEEVETYKALHTNYPITTILNDENAGMEVSYVADTKNYIDKKFAELNRAIVNTQISLL